MGELGAQVGGAGAGDMVGGPCMGVLQLGWCAVQACTDEPCHGGLELPCLFSASCAAITSLYIASDHGCNATRALCTGRFAFNNDNLAARSTLPAAVLDCRDLAAALRHCKLWH